jgi:hypothetical protein
VQPTTLTGLLTTMAALTATPLNSFDNTWRYSDLLSLAPHSSSL